MGYLKALELKGLLGLGVVGFRGWGLGRVSFSRVFRPLATGVLQVFRLYTAFGLLRAWFRVCRAEGFSSGL